LLRVVMNPRIRVGSELAARWGEARLRGLIEGQKRLIDGGLMVFRQPPWALGCGEAAETEVLEIVLRNTVIGAAAANVCSLGKIGVEDTEMDVLTEVEAPGLAFYIEPEVTEFCIHAGLETHLRLAVRLARKHFPMAERLHVYLGHDWDTGKPVAFLVVHAVDVDAAVKAGYEGYSDEMAMQGSYPEWESFCIDFRYA